MSFYRNLFFFMAIRCVDCGNGDFALGDLAKAFSLLSGQSNCQLKCPNGVKPEINQKHKPSSNGCGIPGLTLDLDSYPGFTACCDEHDLCYDECNSNRGICDEKFKDCLKDTCDMQRISESLTKESTKECKNVADVFHSSAVGLGCAFYLEAQRNACLCSGRKLSKSELKNMQKHDEF